MDHQSFVLPHWSSSRQNPLLTGSYNILCGPPHIESRLYLIIAMARVLIYEEQGQGCILRGDGNANENHTPSNHVRTSDPQNAEPDAELFSRI